MNLESVDAQERRAVIATRVLLLAVPVQSKTSSLMRGSSLHRFSPKALEVIPSEELETPVSREK